MRSRILTLSAAVVLAAGSLTGCGWLGDDDCDTDASAAVQTLAKPGGGTGSGSKGGSKSGSKSKPKKTHNTGGSHVDDCDDD